VGVCWWSRCQWIGYLPLPELNCEDVVKSSAQVNCGEQMSRFMILGELTK
jgi:hypothetical protein